MSNVRLVIILCKVLIILGGFFFGLLFLVQNIDVLKQSFTLSLELFGTGLKWTPEQQIPYYYLLVGAFAFGGVFAAAFFLLDRINLFLRNQRQKSQTKKSIRVLESEIARLRAENERLTQECDVKRIEEAKNVELEEAKESAA